MNSSSIFGCDFEIPNQSEQIDYIFDEDLLTFGESNTSNDVPCAIPTNAQSTSVNPLGYVNTAPIASSNPLPSFSNLQQLSARATTGTAPVNEVQTQSGNGVHPNTVPNGNGVQSNGSPPNIYHSNGLQTNGNHANGLQINGIRPNSGHSSGGPMNRFEYLKEIALTLSPCNSVASRNTITPANGASNGSNVNRMFKEIPSTMMSNNSQPPTHAVTCSDNSASSSIQAENIDPDNTPTKNRPSTSKEQPLSSTATHIQSPALAQAPLSATNRSNIIGRSDKQPQSSGSASQQRRYINIKPCIKDTNEADNRLAAGILANSYELIIEIGSGTYGKVYKARSKRSNQIVAAKRVHCEIQPHQMVMRHFWFLICR